MDMLSTSEIIKVDTALGLVLGFAIICKDNGVDHFDLQEHHIPEDVMLKAATEFMMAERVGKEMHSGDQTGTVTFAFPLTTEIAKAFGITTPRTGLMIAMKPATVEALNKFASGEYKGFSIGGGGLLVDFQEAA